MNKTIVRKQKSNTTIVYSPPMNKVCEYCQHRPATRYTPEVDSGDMAVCQMCYEWWHVYFQSMELKSDWIQFCHDAIRVVEDLWARFKLLFHISEKP
jgi:hypothetical protein